MDPIQLFNPLDQIASTFLNSFQDITRSLRVASTIPTNLLATATGEVGVIFQCPSATPIPTGTPVKIDGNADYRDRILLTGLCVYPSPSATIPDVDDTNLNLPAVGPYTTRIGG